MKRDLYQKPEEMYLIRKGLDLNLVFSARNYTLNMALARALALGGELYYRNQDCKVFTVSFPEYIKDGSGKVIKVVPSKMVPYNKKTSDKNTGFHPEMLELGEYIPGAINLRQ